MPKTDPITGCQVMTFGEFWASEAKQEGQGRCGAELMAETMDDMQTSFEHEARRMKEDPSDILKTLRAWFIPEDDSWSWDEGDEPKWVPEAIVEVEDVEVDGSFKDSGWTAVVKVRCSDDETRRLKVTYSTFHGDFYEPPSDDLNWEVLS
jgi:hypothetical protein